MFLHPEQTSVEYAVDYDCPRRVTICRFQRELVKAVHFPFSIQ